jgi:WD40 repeat protein
MQVFQLTRESVWFRQMSFSPDGRRLALDGKSFTLLDTTGQEQPQELPIENHGLGFAFVRGGAAIAYLPKLDLLGEYNLTTRQTRSSLIEDGIAAGIAADPAADAIYLGVHGLALVGGSKYSIRVITLDDWKEQARFGTVSDNLDKLTLSADGRWIGATCYERVRVWNVGRPRPPSRPKLSAPPGAWASKFAISADGGHLVIVSRAGVEIWATASGERIVSSGKHRSEVTAVACSPTRTLLATGDHAGKVFLWDYTGRVLTRYDWGLGEVYGLAFAPDGLRCAAVDSRGKVVLWDVNA